VTVTGWSKLSAVSTNMPGDTVPSPGFSLVTITATSSLGAADSDTAIIAVPPASVVLRSGTASTTSSAWPTRLLSPQPKTPAIATTISRRVMANSVAQIRETCDDRPVMHPVHDIEVPDDLATFVPSVIEIPRGSFLKYEVDKATGFLRLDRVLYSAVHYPAN